MICLRFHPNEINFPTPIREEQSDKTPVYWTKQNVIIYDVEYLMSTYSFYFNNNYAVGCGHSLCPANSYLGFHEHDIEHVSIYSWTGVPVMVYFSAHGRGQGMWKQWDKCEKDKDGRLVVYIARNSHACYPEPKTYWRVFGLANDECSSKGKQVTPTTFYKSFDWCSPNGVKLYSDSRPNHPLLSITNWQRFFLPFYF